MTATRPQQSVRPVWLAAVALLIFSSSGVQAADDQGCWWVDSWWPASCGWLSQGDAVCSRGWGVYGSWEGCCQAQFASSGGCTAPKPSMPSMPSPSPNPGPETAAPNEASPVSCIVSGGWTDFGFMSSGPCKNVDGVGAPAGFCFGLVPGTTDTCWPGTVLCPDPVETTSPPSAPTTPEPVATSTVPQATTPTAAPTTLPTTSTPTDEATPPPSGGPSPPPTGEGLPPQVKQILDTTAFEGILQSKTPTNQWVPSQIYVWADLVEALRNMYTVGVDGDFFWLGDDDEEEAHIYGLVSVAAFLAQSMKETIQYDACDENSWDQSSSYAASNACGQLGQSYQDYNCPAGEEHMQCEVDPDMTIRATTHAAWYGAPPALFCAPRSKLPEAPRWSYGGWCDPSEAHDTDMSVDEYVEYVRLNAETCREYEGQKAGEWLPCDGGCPSTEAPLFDRPARTDVEGCCWWGRGVIQTTGVCNYGKLSYFLGKKAADDGRQALFPDIDFCREPDAICSSAKYPQLKWIAGLFYWMNAVQPYSEGGWTYLDRLKAFVDGGMADSSFIDGVSGIVNRGCFDAQCGTGPVDGLQDRRDNFQRVLVAMGLV